MRDFPDTMPHKTASQRAADRDEFERLIAHLLPPPQPLPPHPNMPPDVEPDERDDASMEALAWWLVAVAVVAVLAGVVVWVTA